jgi:hypothetical protein
VHGGDVDWPLCFLGLNCCQEKKKLLKTEGSTVAQIQKIASIQQLLCFLSESKLLES